MVEQIRFCKAGLTEIITEKSWIKAVSKRVVNLKKKSPAIKSFCFATLLLMLAPAAKAVTTVAPAAPAWGFDPVTGTLLTPGVSVNTMGTLQIPRPGDGDHTLKFFDVRSATLSPARLVQSPDTHLHHNWDVGSIGNVFGLAIDNDRNVYTTASTHFSSYYGFELGNAANILFGSIGAGAVPDTAALDNNPGTLNDLNAAGSTYKIDATSGNVTLFATLPQTATVFSHEACEGGPAIARNTGPALGNVAYDKVRDQLYISNFQDGRIYLFDASATVPAGGFDETDALSVFDPVGFEGITSADQASPYGLAVSPDGTQLYYGTHEINKTPQLFAVNLDANGAFVGTEIDQNAQLGTDLQYTQDLGGVFSSDNANSHAWVSYSDLNFSPAGELIIGLRTGCLNNFATSHNHGGVYYLLKQDAGGLYNTPADKVPGTGTTYVGNPDTTIAFTLASPAEAATRTGGGRYDAGAISIYSDKVGVGAVDSGADDGYGGIAIYDKGDGTYDYLITSSDMTQEEGPHGFMLFPHNFTLDTSATPGTNLINPLASFPSLPSSTTAAGQDYKGVGGDIEVLSVLVDWGDAPDTYSTDLITGNATGGADVKGPTHILTADGIILGTSVDHEFNGVPSVGADGDDNASVPDDEDGISSFPTLISTATTYTIPIANISAANSSAGAVTIHAWIDFDGNGSFDPDEYTTTTVASGATAPATALTWSGAGVSGQSAGTTYARFRITNDPGINATTPGGPASNGEVEDYSLEIVEQVSLGSTIWEDTDADGTQDAAEPAIVGATVTLLNADGTVYDSDPVTAGVQALTDVTDADGQYNFNAIPPNDYRVQVDLSTVTGGDNYIPTPTQVADPDAAGPGQDNNTDSNVDTAFDPNVNDLIHTSGVITLTVGGEPTGETDPIGAGGVDQPNQGLTTETEPDNGGNMTVDMGFIKPVSLGSTAWLDSDEDGVQDAAEPGIVGATVTLLNADGTVFDNDPNTAGVQALTDTTDADGQYNFNDIPEGDYRVQIDLATATNTGSATFIPSPTQVADPDAAGPGQDNNTDSNIDEPFDPNTADQIHTSGVITLSLGGEPTSETDPIGAGGPDQPNQGLTAANQPDADGNMTVDFGFIEPVSLGSLVWLDSDADGVQDAAEPAIIGATVTLLNADGTVFDNDPNTAGVQSLTDVTDASGLYNFNGLPEGDYRVQVNLNTATSHTASYLAVTPTQVADPDAAGPGQDNNTDSNVDNTAPGHNPAGNIYQSGVVTLSVGGEPSGEADAIIGGADQPNQTAAQPDNSGNMTVDFGFIQPVSLGSTIWQDSDADGIQDAAEPAIVGATVTLLNADGTVFDSDPDTAGVQALTDITDGDGQYNFNDLPPGDYRVQVDLSTVVNGSDLLPSPIQVADPDAAGPGQDNNTDSNVDLAFDVNTTDLIHTSGVVTLTSGGEPTSETDPIGAGGPDQPNQTLTATDDPDNAGNMTVDMAFVKPVSIGSTVWKDNDFDGVQDAAEPGIVGATVTLLNADGTTYDSNPYVAGVQALTDITDADGQYNFDGLVPGDYRVQVDLATATNTNASAFIPTLVQVADPDAAGPGQDNNTDSNIDEPFDPNTADQIHTSGVITLSAGGEPTGETDPIGAGGTDQPNQGLTVTNDPDNSGNMTVDFGFFEPVSLGSTVWFDSDSDGTQDAAEPAIVGATVTLLSADGTVYDSDPVTAGVQSLTDVTDGDGQYNFNNLPEGDYRVQVDLNTATSHTGGALQVTPTQIADPDAAGPGQDNNTDSNVDNTAPGHNPAGNIYQSGVVTLSIGSEPTGETDPIGAGGADQPNQTAAQPDANGNMTVDFGFISPVSLGSTIWEDTDADGTQNAAEPAIVGATVTLLNADGTVFDSDPNTAGVQALTDITDADGQYNFDGLPPGDYRVQVDLSTVTGGDDYIASPVQVADPDAAGPGQDNNTDSNVDVAFDPNVIDLIHTSGVITLTVGGEPTSETDPIGAGGADQPNQGLTATDDPDNAGNMTVDMGFIKPVSLGSTAWLDSDEDGVQDAAEPGIVGATVTLLNADGSVFDNDPNTAGVQALTDTTDADGQYNFNDIPEGDYRVQIDLATATNTGSATFIPSPSQIADPDAAGPGQDNNTDSNIDEPFDPNTADQVHTSGVITLSVGGEPTGETDPIGAGGPDQPNQGLTAANQPDANGNMTVDFGFIEPVSLGSTVWFDSDSDGTQDAAEPAIVGATVTLLNADGTVFDNDPVAAGVQSLTDVTDGDGQYNFNDLPEGNYRVQVDLNTATSHTGGALAATPTQVADPDAAGPGQDNNTDSNVDDTAPGHNPAGNIYQSGVVTLSVGGEPTTETDPIGAGGADQPNQTAAQPDNSGNMTVDFGFVAPVSLGSTIWEDTDADGTQDAAEPAIVGATITLLNADGTVFDSDPNTAGVQALIDVTDADGQYNFDGIIPGDYRVQVDLSTVTGGDDYIASPVQVADPDAAGPGQDNNTDSNVDTAFDPNVNDLIHTSGVITLTVGGEPTGETDPIGAGGADQPNQGLTATDDPDNAGNMTVDMGFIKPVSLGSTAWLDSDEDGVQDAAEPGIVGATVTLLNADGSVFDNDPNTAGVQALTDTTDADGQYNFNDIPEGDYRVQIDLATATNTGSATFIPSPSQIADPDAAGPGQDNNTDSNIDEPFDPNTADQIHTSGVITLSVGGEPTSETDPIGAGGADQPNQGLTAANQPDANGNMTVDFGFIEPVSLGSLVWFDNDSDGVQDSGEPAIVGATVTLLNADGTVFDNDPVAAGVQSLTDVTDAAGLYNFNDLPEGDYRVQVDLNTATSHTGGALAATPTQVADPDAAGPGQDNNTDSNVDNTAPGHNPAGNIYQSGVVTLSIGGEPTGETDTIAGGADQPNQTAAQPDNNGNMTVDFGFIAPVSLGSTIWEDTDADGTQDAAEPAIVGATITLLNADGTIFDSDPNTAGVQALIDVTDADGQYNFDGIIPGDYRVQVDLSTVTGGDDYIVSPVQVADPDAAGPGQDNNTDSNVDVAFDPNVNDLIHTSGVITLTVGGEPTGETDPIGAGGADQPNQGLTATDDPDNAGNMTVDMGFIKPVSLGSTAWLDSDEDGVQDAAEPGIVGATVTLLNTDGSVFDNDPNTAGVQALTDTTDADGQYNFNDIPEGDYRVQIDLATATNAGSATFIPSPSQIADPDAAGPGQDNNTDSNIDEPFDPNTADQIHTSGVITLSVGGEPTSETDPIGAGGPDQPNQGLTAANQPDANGNMTVDFGFIEPVSLGSLVWLDSDADGVQDSAEPAIVGATVTLLNADGTVFDNDPVAAGVQSLTDVTDAAGLYNFNDLPEGDYRVQIDLNTATSHTDGYLEVTPTQVADPDAAGPGQDNNTDSNVDNTAPGHNPAGNIYQSGVVTLSVGGEPTSETDTIAGGADQPNQTAAQPDNSGNMSVDFGFIQPVSLGSTIWEDLNGDGTQDAAEPGITGATITLLNPDGTVFDSDPNTAGIQSLTDTTDADGQYNFDGLPPGDYRVQVDLSTVTGGSDLFVSPVQVADPDAAGPGQDNNTDSNVDLAFDVNLTDQIHTSGVITLSPGSEPTVETDPIGAGGPDQPNQGLTATDDPDNSGNMTVDMAFVRPVSIGSTVWEDSNGDGIQDDAELLIVGATATLLNADGTVFDSDPYTAGVQALTAITDAEGQYNFNSLPPGDYRVQMDVSTVTGGANFVPTLNQVADPDAAGPGQDNNTDTNIDIAFDTNLTDSIHTSGIVTLVAGGEPTGETDPIDLIDGNGPVPDQPNQTATDPDNSGNMTVDFGFIATVSLGSLIWEDTNADGLQSPNEPPMAGAMVQLLMEDTNALSPTFGQFIPATDVTNASVPVFTTGLNGLYLFDNLRPGDYKVLVIPTSGHFPTLVQNPTDDNIENDSNLNLAATGADNAGGLPAGTFESNIVTLESGKEFVETDDERGDAQDGVNGSPVDESGNMTLDIGFIPPATIGNYVWLDLDMDGIQDANEDGIAGVQVILTPPAGVDVGAGPGNPIMTNTGPNGEYLFPDLPPYTDASPTNGYVVSVNPATLPPSLVQTFDEGPGGLVGVLDHTSDPIQLDPNEEHLTADFGYAPPLGSIGDTIWIDADDDGVQDPGEPGIPNVTVTLTPAPDVDLGSGLGVPISVVTDNNGKYLFPNLPLDAVYVVDVDITTLPPGYVSSVSGLGDPDVRDGNSTTADDQTTVLLTTSSPVNLDADFGYLPPADQNNSVGDTIWIDVDSDGEGPAGAVGGTDTNELPLVGVTVSLIDNSTGDVIATDITDTNGQYLFNGIPDGNYTVVVTDQNNVLDGLDPTYDDDGLGTPNQSTVDLDSGSTVFTPVADLDQDFGYVSPNNTGAVGSIGDTVFFDADNSGTLDPGEGLEGVVVSLYGPGPDGDITTIADNELLATDVTDENGNYLFLGLDVSDTGPNPGTDYQVVVDTTTLPNGGTGWTNSIDPDTPNPGDSMSVTTLTVANPVDLDQDFGYIGTDNNTLSGTVWPDTDGDGTQAEIGVFSGVTIEVRDQNGNVIQKVVTDVNGNYSVTNLPDGIYVVVVTDEDNVLAPYEHTDSPNGASDTSDQTSKDDTGYTVDLDSTSISATPVTDTTGDFGYQPTITNPISLGSFKSELIDGAVTISWTTQTEVGNIGFNVYMKQGNEWQRLNEHVIPSQGDSTGVQRYSLIVPAGGQYFAIGDIDIYTQETLHGPFTLGKQHGLDVARKATPNKDGAAGAAQEASRRTEKRMQQMQQRNQERKQRLGKPLGYDDGDSKQSPSEELIMNVKKSNTLWSLLIAGTLNVIIPNAYAADANAEDVLNFEVKSEGVYLVTHETLFDYGLDIAGEPVSRIALMNQGVPVPIAVTGSTDAADVFGIGSTIRFVGTGLDTLYTDTNVYTLRLDSDVAQRVDVDNRQPVGPVALSYLATRSYAPQSEYSFVSPDKSDPWYAERLLASGAAVDTQVQLNLDHYVPGGNRGSTKAKLSVNVWGASDSPGTQDHDVKVSFNGQEVVSETFNGLQERVLQGDLNNLSNVSNSVKVELPLASGQAFDLINLNAVTVDYPRAFIADGNELQFNSSQRRFVVQGLESDVIEVYRKDGSGTYQMGNTAVQGSCGEGAAGCAIMFAGTGSEADYYVVTQNALKSPGLRSLPVDDDINSGNAEYLIISHPDFMDTGLLEDLRDSLNNEFDGVAIVDVDNIYAEYGHHIFDPEAIRAYIKSAKANRGTNTVLLVGGDMYDYRQFQNQQARSFIPSIYASTDGVVNFAPVDAKYVDINDDNVPDLSIGRLPVRNVAELSILLTKRTQFLGRNYTGKALFAADGYDHIQQYDFSRDADMVNDDYFAGWDTSKAYVDTDGVQTARSSVVDGINAGQTLTAFFGHSSTNQWSFSGLFNGDDAGSLNNQGKPTVVAQWGCWNTYYVSPSEDSMGHRFMVEGDRGAVSVMGASTLTSANAERELAQLVFARLTNGERLGDAILRAKQDYALTNPDALDVLLGWTLLGMPELVLY